VRPDFPSVTPRPQPGNPKPRIFRLPEAEAIINRMGFNNLGVDHLLSRVQAAKYKGILGINIGKNFDTPVERAVDDYLICLDKVYAHASYVTVNVSSPNTPGLRSLSSGTRSSNCSKPCVSARKTWPCAMASACRWPSRLPRT
jgi:dihydroorotate dehydrogenase